MDSLLRMKLLVSLLSTYRKRVITQSFDRESDTVDGNQRPAASARVLWYRCDRYTDTLEWISCTALYLTVILSCYIILSSLGDSMLNHEHPPILLMLILTTKRS
jgi:hypothetical protein